LTYSTRTEVAELELLKLFEEHWVSVGAPPLEYARPAATLPEMLVLVPPTDLDTRPVRTFATVWDGFEIVKPAEVEMNSVMVVDEKPVGAPRAEALARTSVIRRVRVGSTAEVPGGSIGTLKKVNVLAAVRMPW
jgi:hypothetical protein